MHCASVAEAYVRLCEFMLLTPLPDSIDMDQIRLERRRMAAWGICCWNRWSSPCISCGLLSASNHQRLVDAVAADLAIGIRMFAWSIAVAPTGKFSLPVPKPALIADQHPLTSSL